MNTIYSANTSSTHTSNLDDTQCAENSIDLVHSEVKQASRSEYCVKCSVEKAIDSKEDIRKKFDGTERSEVETEKPVFVSSSSNWFGIMLRSILAQSNKPCSPGKSQAPTHTSVSISVPPAVSTNTSHSKSAVILPAVDPMSQSISAGSVVGERASGLQIIVQESGLQYENQQSELQVSNSPNLGFKSQTKLCNNRTSNSLSPDELYENDIADSLEFEFALAAKGLPSQSYYNIVSIENQVLLRKSDDEE